MSFISKLQSKYQYNSRLLTSAIVIIVVGFIFGFMASGDLKHITFQVDRISSSRVKIFINAFTINYWYLFVSWIAGMVSFGLIVNYFIAFFKGFIWGVTFTLLIRSEAVFGFFSFFKLILLQILFLLPALIYVTYQGVKMSLVNLGIITIKNRDSGNYFKVILVSLILVVLYSFFNSLFTNIIR